MMIKENKYYRKFLSKLLVDFERVSKKNINKNKIKIPYTLVRLSQWNNLLRFKKISLKTFRKIKWQIGKYWLSFNYPSVKKLFRLGFYLKKRLFFFKFSSYLLLLKNRFLFSVFFNKISVYSFLSIFKNTVRNFLKHLGIRKLYNNIIYFFFKFFVVYKPWIYFPQWQRNKIMRLRKLLLRKLNKFILRGQFRKLFVFFSDKSYNFLNFFGNFLYGGLLISDNTLVKIGFATFYKQIVLCFF